MNFSYLTKFILHTHILYLKSIYCVFNTNKDITNNLKAMSQQEYKFKK